jgi:hypothetical protein
VWDRVVVRFAVVVRVLGRGFGLGLGLGKVGVRTGIWGYRVRV